LKKSLNKLRPIGVDTNIFIYYLNRASLLYPVADRVFTTILANDQHIHTSILTLSELLSFPGKTSSLDKLENEFTNIPNIQMHDVTKPIALKAASIRRLYNFRLTDAVQIATAIHANAEMFITNDKKLTRCKELPIRLLSSC